MGTFKPLKAPPATLYPKAALKSKQQMGGAITAAVTVGGVVTEAAARKLLRCGALTSPRMYRRRRFLMACRLTASSRQILSKSFRLRRHTPIPISLHIPFTVRRAM